jgi:imidazolonepropionase-like amidohydrolase
MSKLKNIKSVCFVFLLAHNLYAQPTTTIIMNGTIHVGNGEVIENGVLVMEQGKIVQVGKTLNTLYKTAKVIDAKNKHIYPGLIAMNNIMGLNEIDAVRATHDYDENGSFNPNVRSLIAFNTDSKILPTAIYNGILFTQPVPQGGVISGSSSLMKAKGWNWEDAVVKTDDGIHLNWPQIGRNKPDEENQGEKEVMDINRFFADAYQYSQQAKPVFNARLAAMNGVFTRKMNLYVHANDAKSLVRAITFFKQNHPTIKLVLVGAQEAYLITDLIRSYQIPVVLGNIHRLPAHNADGIDQPYQTPAQLAKLGITFALSQEGSWEARNLSYLAGTAAAYGLAKEEALMAITLTPAKIMGVDQQIGSLELGKDASLIICEGDLLDMKSSALSMVFLNGEEIDLKNEQVLLFEKYKKKYKID